MSFASPRFYIERFWKKFMLPYRQWGWREGWNEGRREGWTAGYKRACNDLDLQRDVPAVSPYHPWWKSL